MASPPRSSIPAVKSSHGAPNESRRELAAARRSARQLSETVGEMMRGDLPDIKRVDGAHAHTHSHVRKHRGCTHRGRTHATQTRAHAPPHRGRTHAPWAPQMNTSPVPSRPVGACSICGTAQPAFGQAAAAVAVRTVGRRQAGVQPGPPARAAVCSYTCAHGCFRFAFGGSLTCAHGCFQLHHSHLTCPALARIYSNS